MVLLISGAYPKYTLVLPRPQAAPAYLRTAIHIRRECQASAVCIHGEDQPFVPEVEHFIATLTIGSPLKSIME